MTFLLSKSDPALDRTPGWLPGAAVSFGGRLSCGRVEHPLQLSLLLGERLLGLPVEGVTLPEEVPHWGHFKACLF